MKPTISTATAGKVAINPVEAITVEAIKPVSHAQWQLFLCSMAALYWELVLIRWLGSCVRLAAYYSNFVLIAAFWGLATGVLLTRFSVRLQRLIFPALGACLLLGLLLGGFSTNLSGSQEFVWIGAPRGVYLPQMTRIFSAVAVLSLVYCAVAGVFLIFGQWIGFLFRQLPSLRAYSVEIFGSIVGIVLFASLAYFQTSPPVWMLCGFVLLALVMNRKKVDYIVAGGCCAMVFFLVIPFSNSYIWSPYYRIHVKPLVQVFDDQKQALVALPPHAGYTIEVNNDYHQMILDLHKRDRDVPFFKGWRYVYDLPYAGAAKLPPGPILVIGAGTGNDVSAALRNTDRQVYAVEIDPAIARLGMQLHPEHPYDNPRVTRIINDARSFFQTTDQHFALIVFGFLDSHTLLSSFSSLRLDNFVYTLQSLQRAHELLLPGGTVSLTFATNTAWIHSRMMGLMDSAFDFPTQAIGDPSGIANGVVYINHKASAATPANPSHQAIAGVLPTDDWPFLYLRNPTIPSHYIAFLAVALILGASSLLLLPRGSRQIRMPYFFLGAAFFLIEASNVIALSLLYGSTWYVNAVVFAGILLLVLLGNLTVQWIGKVRLGLCFGLLAASVCLAYVMPVSALLGIESAPLRAMAAVGVFLGPVYFAGCIFASLIKEEKNFYQAYGSNVLGAVVGGVCEYFSLALGFKMLLVIVLAFYLAAFLFLKIRRSSVAVRMA
ncbi:MAG TPA: class I SAM-dependent methyltransferase [Tepidisphaeraceae bacterium]|jgi:hypothetical protein|nr:class I SAM-dependent methyltransferase [Tepidisphaeraceae bacterium]